LISSVLNLLFWNLVSWFVPFVAILYSVKLIFDIFCIACSGGLLLGWILHGAIKDLLIGRHDVVFGAHSDCSSPKGFDDF
jgi:hypothetical protein